MIRSFEEFSSIEQGSETNNRRQRKVDESVSDEKEQLLDMKVGLRGKETSFFNYIKNKEVVIVLRDGKVLDIANDYGMKHEGEYDSLDDFLNNVGLTKDDFDSNFKKCSRMKVIVSKAIDDVESVYYNKL